MVVLTRWVGKVVRMDVIYIDDDVYMENSLEEGRCSENSAHRECRTFGRSVCRRMFMYVSSEERQKEL